VEIVNRKEIDIGKLKKGWILGNWNGMEIWNQGNGVNRAIGGNRGKGLEVVWKRVGNGVGTGRKWGANKGPTGGNGGPTVCERFANSSPTVRQLFANSSLTACQRFSNGLPTEAQEWKWALRSCRGKIGSVRIFCAITAIFSSHFVIKRVLMF